MIFQPASLFTWLSVLDNVAFGLDLQGIDTVPLGLPIVVETSDQFSGEQWLRIQGVFGRTLVRNRPALVVIPSPITPIPEPQKACINGVF